MKLYAESVKKANGTQISMNEPELMTRRLKSTFQLLNPHEKFDGFFIHYPLSSIEVYNKYLTVSVHHLFISSINIKEWAIQSGEQTLLTISIPWKWLYHNCSHDIYYNLKKKLFSSLILTSINLRELGIDKLVSDPTEESRSSVMDEKVFFLKNEILCKIFDEYLFSEDRNNIISVSNTDEQANKIYQVYERYVSNPFIKLPEIEQIAKEIQMCSASLKKRFKEMYGMPIYACHTEIKLHHARILLQKGYKVIDISMALHYSQPTKFISIFKKKYNVTPGALKNCAC